MTSESKKTAKFLEQNTFKKSYKQLFLAIWFSWNLACMDMRHKKIIFTTQCINSRVMTALPSVQLDFWSDSDTKLIHFRATNGFLPIRLWTDREGTAHSKNQKLYLWRLDLRQIKCHFSHHFHIFSHKNWRKINQFLYGVI